MIGTRVSAPNAEAQLAVIADLATRPLDQVAAAEREAVFEVAQQPATPEVQTRAAVLLSQWYPTIAPRDPDFAQRTHTLLLRDLRQPRKTLAHPSCSWLVMTHLREENLAHIPWQSADEVASAAECFYGTCEAGLEAEESHRRVRDLVRYAGLRFAEQQRWEELFSLFARVPVTADQMDADLFRLRNALLLYEQRRVVRMRRYLWLLLAGAACFVLLVSPPLFLAFENAGRATPLSLFEAAYWSVITSMTVGYGEIVPHSTPGRVLAVVDGSLGMLLMGVVAGLILSHTSRRTLP